MIDRYKRPRMGLVWEPASRFAKWLEIEILACEAWAELGVVPREAAAAIKEKADFDAARIAEIEARVRHDVLAFTTNVAEYVGAESRFIHLGLTSSDILDTALALQMREAADIIMEDLAKLAGALREKAAAYAYIPMIGRTHGVHAEPVTLGIKFATWLYAVERDEKRMQAARENSSVGKLSGAVGTYANVDPFVEEYVCRKLGLTPAKVSTQIVPRDLHAEYLNTLAIIAATIENLAVEIRSLQRTEIREMEEPFATGQKGSSAMPHKRNPVGCENIAGLARVIRSNALAGLENVTLWHERDISHSSVERIIIPDSTILLDYILARFTGIVENLVVYPENMRANLAKTRGLIFSQRVLLALVAKGCSREDAYAVVQDNAMRAWREGGDFKTLVENDAAIAGYLSPGEVAECFDYGYHLKHVDTILRRFGIEGRK